MQSYDLRLHWRSNRTLSGGRTYPTTVPAEARMVLGMRWMLRTWLELLGKGFTKRLYCLATYIIYTTYRRNPKMGNGIEQKEAFHSMN